MFGTETYYPRFTKPFYYGRAANGMAFILMFNKTFAQEDQIRFSLFKFKVPRHPRPAWDYQYVVNKVEKDREYGHGSIQGGSLKRSLGMAKLRKHRNHPQILRI